jgi:hypothetical protein
MCGSRTGGWSLPSVMSDWQRCVDWLLAKYCRCRLRLDLCWCRWRTGAKGHCRWGLQVWRRQVGLVRWTRPWPAGLSAGRVVARTTRWSRWTVYWLSHKTKVDPGLRGSRVMSGDWRRLHQVRGVCGGSPENHRVTQLSHKAEVEDRTWLSGQNRPCRLGEPVYQFGVAWRRKLRGGGHTSGSQGLRRGYEKCGRQASVRWCYKDIFPKCPWWACILV